MPIARHERQTPIFDGDDTLWENNVSCERAIDDFITDLHRSTLASAAEAA
jgi:hypothetical protein